MPSTVVLEKTPESPLDSKEIKPVNHKGDQLWIFTGRTDVDTEAQVFWSSDENRQLIGKVYDTGKDWGQKEKRASEDETVGWQHLKWTWTWANSGKTEGVGKGFLFLRPSPTSCFLLISCSQYHTQQVRPKFCILKLHILIIIFIFVLSEWYFQLEIIFSPTSNNYWDYKASNTFKLMSHHI